MRPSESSNHPLAGTTTNTRDTAGGRHTDANHMNPDHMNSNHMNANHKDVNNMDANNEKQRSDYGATDTDAHGNSKRPSIFNRIRYSALFQRLMRVLQFLSSFISLILFSIRIAKVLRLTKTLSHASGAIEGILAAAVVYTLLLMLMRFCMHHTAAKSNIITWLLVVLDLSFVGAFIAVAVLTSPKHGGDSAPCSRTRDGFLGTEINRQTFGKTACNLPWGTFGLAIFSTLLHAATVVFRQGKEHYKQKKAKRAGA
ncbi:hypothetical protein AAFC00_002743 [Neodothiora populina]